MCRGDVVHLGLEKKLLVSCNGAKKGYVEDKNSSFGVFFLLKKNIFMHVLCWLGVEGMDKTFG